MIVQIVLALVTQDAPQAPPPVSPTEEEVRTSGRVVGLEFTESEAKLMLRGVTESLRGFERMQKLSIDNAVAPATAFAPLIAGVPARPEPAGGKPFQLPDADRTENVEDLAFADIPTLASLIRSRKVSCVELTKMYLARLRRLDKTLSCVITFTEERALERAGELDREIAAGKWRGPLHGIPYGAKDLLAAKGYPTTWGSVPFKEQKIDLDATVIRKLDEAGAVLIAKLTLGELAWGDVWFGGTTKNPWNPKEGSSGSSAGSASATAAGGVAFAIGSETLGSIVSPATRCGCSALRPTFGRVSRHGAMALAWSMDKLGPICRSVRDAEIVFAAIQGPDPLDDHLIDQPYSPPGVADVKGWKVGYLKDAFDRSERDKKVLEELTALGVDLVEIELPSYPVTDMTLVLWTEAAAAFDELTRSGKDDLLVRQVDQAWPNVFRYARLVPAVEYVRANRLRTMLMRDMAKAMEGIEAYVHPSFGGSSLTLTNLTGHPTVVLPSGFAESGSPYSISFTGQLFGESKLIALADAWQRSTSYHKRHPRE